MSKRINWNLIKIENRNNVEFATKLTEINIDCWSGEDTLVIEYNSNSKTINLFCHMIEHVNLIRDMLDFIIKHYEKNK